MKSTEVGCYLEVNVATGNIDRIPVDPREMERRHRTPATSIKEACGGFCQHTLEKCLRLPAAGEEAQTKVKPG